MSVVAGTFKALCQSRLEANREDEEFEEAYHLARVVQSDRPKGGFVPTAEVGTKTLYGGPTGYYDRPFRARLRGNVWTVMGAFSSHTIQNGEKIEWIATEGGEVAKVRRVYRTVGASRCAKTCFEKARRRRLERRRQPERPPHEGV